MKMQTIELPIFGTTELEIADWDYKYESHIWAYQFEDLIIDLDVHFKEVNASNTQRVSKALIDLKGLKEIGAKIISADFFENETVKAYIDEWNEDIFKQIFTQDGFDAFLRKTDKNRSFEERLLSLIRLVRVGVYAESDDSFVTMDYAFGYDIEKGFRDNMLVVKLNADYKLCEIVMEG